MVKNVLHKTYAVLSQSEYPETYFMVQNLSGFSLRTYYITHFLGVCQSEMTMLMQKPVCDLSDSSFIHVMVYFR